MIKSEQTNKIKINKNFINKKQNNIKIKILFLKTKL